MCAKVRCYFRTAPVEFGKDGIVLFESVFDLPLKLGEGDLKCADDARVDQRNASNLLRTVRILVGPLKQANSNTHAIA